jgi:hypothetical protein
MKLSSFFFPKLRLAKIAKPAATTSNKLIETKTRASYAIKSPPVRNVSYEIGDIKTAVTLATNFDRPDRSRLLSIYDYIMQDSHLSSQVMIAVNKVISEQYGLYKGETLDKEATRFLQSAWFEQTITWLLEAEFFGFSLVEFDLIPKEKRIETLLIYRNCVQPDKKLLLLEGNINGLTVPYGDFMSELNLVQFGKPNDLGLLQKASYNVLWKFYARSDWSRTSEKFGMPFLHIKANTNVEAELDRIEEKAANFGSDGYIVTQSGDEVQMEQRSSDDIHKIYLENINYCDDQISKLINGQTATSDEKAFSGSANVQERVLEDISFARMRRVKYAVNNQLIPYLVDKGFTFLNGLEFDYAAIKEPKANPTPTPEPPEPNEPPAKKKLHRSVDSEFINSALHNLYFGKHDAGCDCHLHHTQVYKLTLSRKSVIDGAVNAILAEDYSEDVNTDLFNLYYKDYQKAVDQVFPAGVNPDLARKFKLNAAQFAAHKTYQVNGLIKDAGQDKKAAFDQVSKHNRYHQAETTTITARARTARQWERFEKERHLYPNLTWIRTRSANPRELHLSYVGITLPMNDPFWQNNQPGNLWNCKCDWKTTDAPVSEAPEKIVQPAKGLEGNPFETGELITQKHPYFRNVPERIANNALLQLPDNLAYLEVETEGGSYFEHILIEQEQEYAINTRIAEVLVNNGMRNLSLLPKIHESEVSLRLRYYGSKYCEKNKTKCPDAKSGTSLLEFKQSNGKRRSITDRISEAARKSDIVILLLGNPVDQKILRDIAIGRKQVYKNLSQIIILTHDLKYLSY